MGYAERCHRPLNKEGPDTHPDRHTRHRYRRRRIAYRAYSVELV